MQLLAEDQIRHIEDRLSEASLTNASLSIDILDHICCMIEDRLDLGWEYTKAEKEVFSQMGVLQLQAIEQETNILTQNKIAMKKRTIIIGVVAIVLMAVGFIMKVNHLQGAAFLWSIGILDMAFGFGIFLTMDRFSYEKTSAGKINSIIGFLGVASFVVGFGFKLLNWPFATNAMIIGGFVLVIHYVLSNSFSSLN